MYFTFEGLGGFILNAEKITGTAIEADTLSRIRADFDALQAEFNEEFEPFNREKCDEYIRRIKERR